jgi:hypothetical protein
METSPAVLGEEFEDGPPTHPSPSRGEGWVGVAESEAVEAK